MADGGEAGCSLIELNAGFERLTDYDREDALTHNCRFLQAHPDSRAVAHNPDLADVRTFLSDTTQTHNRTCVLNFRKCGQPFVNQVSLTRIYNMDGSCAFILGSQFDLTGAAPEDLLHYNEIYEEYLGRFKLNTREAKILRRTADCLDRAAKTIAQSHVLIANIRLSI